MSIQLTESREPKTIRQNRRPKGVAWLFLFFCILATATAAISLDWTPAPSFCPNQCRPRLDADPNREPWPQLRHRFHPRRRAGRRRRPGDNSPSSTTSSEARHPWTAVRYPDHPRPTHLPAAHAPPSSANRPAASTARVWTPASDALSRRALHRPGKPPTSPARKHKLISIRIFEDSHRPPNLFSRLRRQLDTLLLHLFRGSKHIIGPERHRLKPSNPDNSALMSRSA